MRGRIARLTLAVCIGLILAALWVNVALQVSPWIAVALLTVALGLAAVVGGVMGTAGTAVVLHAEQSRRAIESAAARRQAIEHRQAVDRIIAANRKAIER